MVVGKDGEKVQEWLELPNGCMCCTMKDSLVTTLELLIKKKNAFDYILVESTGMVCAICDCSYWVSSQADPGPVAGIFWLDDALDSSIYLDGIVTVVDSKHLLLHLDDKTQHPQQQQSQRPQQPEHVQQEAINEAERQIAFADVVIINKTDLVDDNQIQEIERRVKGINRLAPTIR